MSEFGKAALAYIIRATMPEFAEGPFSRVYFVHADAPSLTLEGQKGDKL